MIKFMLDRAISEACLCVAMSMLFLLLVRSHEVKSNPLRRTSIVSTGRPERLETASGTLHVPASIPIYMHTYVESQMEDNVTSISIFFSGNFLIGWS